MKNKDMVLHRKCNNQDKFREWDRKKTLLLYKYYFRLLGKWVKFVCFFMNKDSNLIVFEAVHHEKSFNVWKHFFIEPNDPDLWKQPRLPPHIQSIYSKYYSKTVLLHYTITSGGCSQAFVLEGWNPVAAIILRGLTLEIRRLNIFNYYIWRVICCFSNLLWTVSQFVEPAALFEARMDRRSNTAGKLLS